MSHRIYQDLYDALSNHVGTVKDPGASGTIVVGNKGQAICEVETAGAETRVLEAAENLVIGVRCLVVFTVDGGNLTVESDDSDVVLNSAGDVCEFIVTSAAGTKTWRNLAVST